MKRQSIMNHKKVTSLFLLAILSVGGVYAQSKEDLKYLMPKIKVWLLSWQGQPLRLISS